MRLKKSFDYFKTLKKLAVCCEDTFNEVINGNKSGNQSVVFMGMKNELTDNLRKDFITPFDRGDIFVLSDCLFNQFLLLSELSGFVSVNGDDCSYICKLLSEAYNKQSIVFSLINESKDNTNAFSLCKEGYASVINTSVAITKKIKKCVFGCESQPLYKYSVYSALLEISRSVQYTFSQTERILINNS